jgi:hypothetical protein
MRTLLLRWRADPCAQRAQEFLLQVWACSADMRCGRRAGFRARQAVTAMPLRARVSEAAPEAEHSDAGARRSSPMNRGAARWCRSRCACVG